MCAGYCVSDLGRVKRIDTGRLLTLTPRKNGYVSVSLSIAVGIKKRFYVHRLVAAAFVGDLSAGMQVNHIDFQRNNNAACNLEIVTCKENAEHSKAAGRLKVIGKNTPFGDLSSSSKLKSDQVADLRMKRANGHSLRELSLAFGVCKSQVSNIVSGKSWRSTMFKKTAACPCGGDTWVDSFDWPRKPRQWFLRCEACGGMSDAVATASEAERLSIRPDQAQEVTA